MNSSDQTQSNLKSQLRQQQHEIERLKTENAYLKKQLALKNNHHKETKKINETYALTSFSTVNDKICMFKSLFLGRQDVYAVRWESSDGKSGYAPARNKGENLPLTDKVLFDHLSGKITIGIYPLLKDDTCAFLAVDFDKDQWKKEALAFMDICENNKIPAVMERSRSGNGCHIWIFFDDWIHASLARKLGNILLDLARRQRHVNQFRSYDRLFPNQDTLPKGGFGNLIALPLQKQVKNHGNGVFVDQNFNMYPDQWLFLSNVRKIGAAQVKQIINQNPQNTVAHTQSQQPSMVIRETLPKKLKITLADQIYIKKHDLTPAFIQKLSELVAFANPEYYRRKNSRLSTAQTPQIIYCVEESQEHIKIPRACFNDVIQLLEQYSITTEFEDKRFEGETIHVDFEGSLTPKQLDAGKSLLNYDIGVLSAPTGFGKTVLAAWLIAARKINTLIIVNRTELMEQWVEQLSVFFNMPRKSIGQLGSGKNKPMGTIDIAMIQSLKRKDRLEEYTQKYGQVIVDECHHISAVHYEGILSQFSAKYICGLTATPTRKDGWHPIMNMQCGPIRFKISDKELAKTRPFNHILIPRYTSFSMDSNDMKEIYTALVSNEERNAMIFDDVLNALERRRSPLILTERTEHAEILANQLAKFAKNVIILHGKMKKKEQEDVRQKIAEIPNHEERVLISTGSYIGEGFDDGRLDTLFLVMPISWSGTLQQYVGRLHRLHHDKESVQVYDYVDRKASVLERMYKKRLKGYTKMGYKEHHEGDELSDSEQMRLF